MALASHLALWSTVLFANTGITMVYITDNITCAIPWYVMYATIKIDTTNLFFVFLRIMYNFRFFYDKMHQNDGV